MPAPQRSLTPVDVHDYVRRHCFGLGDDGPATNPGPPRLGIELELLTAPIADPLGRPGVSELVDALAATAAPAGSGLTLEPGGQVEVSSLPHAGIGPAIHATSADLDAVRSSLASAGIGTAAVGLDPARPHRRVVFGPRYDAMEAYFGTTGPAGRAMMCGTASVQVNLDLGDAASLPRRWRLAHALGPMLVATFANSPLAGGRPTGARSSRQLVWAALDASRSSPVATAGGPQALNPADTWARYALAADVMLIRTTAGRFIALDHRLSFAAWIGEGHELGYPTIDDFAYHLTTLFPPVRPKGWLELRMVDAVPDPWWKVAVAVVTALMDDPVAFDVAEHACRPVADCWAEAGVHGLSHPGLASAARTCFAAAAAALARLGADPGTVAATYAFIDRFVDRGRSPADDLLDAWTTGAAPRSETAGRR
jgi:glutamate--cysteine ligase